MNAQDFCYWLQGFAELSQDPPTPEQWKSIQEHLKLTFMKVTAPVQTNPFQGLQGVSTGILQC